MEFISAAVVRYPDITILHHLCRAGTVLNGLHLTGHLVGLRHGDSAFTAGTSSAAWGPHRNLLALKNIQHKLALSGLDFADLIFLVDRYGNHGCLLSLMGLKGTYCHYKRF